MISHLSQVMDEHHHLFIHMCDGRLEQHWYRQFQIQNKDDHTYIINIDRLKKGL